MNAPLARDALTTDAPLATLVPQPDPGLAARYHNIADLREGARRRLPRGVFEFFDRGSEDEASLAGNRAAFARLKLRNRMLVDVSRRTTATTLLGGPLSMPLVVAPTGVAGLTWLDGEVELARAAAACGVPFTLATPSITSIETIAAVEGGRKWFQLYMWKDRALSHALVRRARDAGFETLILTGDTPVSPIREYNRRNGFSSPFQFNPRIAFDVASHPRWFFEVMLPYLRKSGMPRQAHYPSGANGRAATLGERAENLRGDDLHWGDIADLRALWKGPILLKGVHRPDDAARALAEGLDGIVVSNHGGRNLDSAVAPIEVLPEIAAEVGAKMTVLLDSGVRRGGDIVKALALGAKAVLSGRPTLYGASVAGARGARHALALLRRELDATMAYVGASRVEEIDADVLWREKRP